MYNFIENVWVQSSQKLGPCQEYSGQIDSSPTNSALLLWLFFKKSNYAKVNVFTKMKGSEKHIFLYFWGVSIPAEKKFWLIIFSAVPCLRCILLFLPHSAILVKPEDCWVSKKKTTLFFTLCASKNLTSLLHSLPPPCFGLSLSLSLTFNAHLQKVEFPLVNAYYVLTTILCAEHWSSASSLSMPGTYFQIFKKWILVSKLRVMGFFIQSGGLPQAGYDLWSFQ